MSDFAMGLIVGASIAAVAYLIAKGHQVLDNIDTFEADPMTHDKLLTYVLEQRPLIELNMYQVRQLIDEHDSLEELFSEAMGRKAELHSELEQVKRVANKVALEAAHCRACCDELRAKLDAKACA